MGGYVCRIGQDKRDQPPLTLLDEGRVLHSILNQVKSKKIREESLQLFIDLGFAVPFHRDQYRSRFKRSGFNGTDNFI